MKRLILTVAILSFVPAVAWGQATPDNPLVGTGRYIDKNTDYLDMESLLCSAPHQFGDNLEEAFSITAWWLNYFAPNYKAEFFVLGPVAVGVGDDPAGTEGFVKTTASTFYNPFGFTVWGWEGVFWFTGNGMSVIESGDSGREVTAKPLVPIICMDSNGAHRNSGVYEVTVSWTYDAINLAGIQLTVPIESYTVTVIVPRPQTTNGTIDPNPKKVIRWLLAALRFHPEPERKQVKHAVAYESFHNRVSNSRSWFAKSPTHVTQTNVSTGVGMLSC